MPTSQSNSSMSPGFVLPTQCIPSRLKLEPHGLSSVQASGFSHGSLPREFLFSMMYLGLQYVFLLLKPLIQTDHLAELIVCQLVFF